MTEAFAKADTLAGAFCCYKAKRGKRMSRNKTKNRKSKVRKKKKSGLGKLLLRLILLLMFLGLGTGIGLVVFAACNAPDVDALDVTPSGFRTEILDEQGKTTRILAGEGANRVYVTLDRVPKELQDAFIAIEDERFYTHHGIDVKGIARAAVKGVLNGFHFSEGASTITQQLLKNNVFTAWISEQTFADKMTRKLQEQYLAVRLEQKESKEWILENYLNTINLGSGCWGIQAASMQYFGKEVSELSLSECSVLAGITKNPSGYNPLKHPEKCRDRQLLVLSAMLEQGYIMQEEYEKAKNDDVFDRIQEQNANRDQSTVLSYYEDALLLQIVEDLQMEKKCTEDEAWQMIYRGGLTIRSCENKELQSIVEEEINNEENYASDAQASVVVMDPHTGQVRAIAGGRGEKTASLVLNRATDSERQPGSTFKIPGEYAAALETGAYTLGTVVDDAPYTYSDGTTVRNASGKYNGQTTIREAISDSLNIPAVKVLQDVGVDTVWNTLKDFGFRTLTVDDKVESLALGGTHNGVTNVQLTAAYGALAAGGEYHKPIFYTEVVDQDNNVLLSASEEGRQVISKENALLLTLAMEDVLKSGTGRKAYFDGMSLAGKTGTTTDKKDLWFVGYSPYYVCGVWGGYDDYREQTESDYVKYLWKNIMRRTHENLSDPGFSGTESLTACEICTKCGNRATGQLCNSSLQGNMTAREYYIPGTAPTKYCDCHEAVNICTASGKKAGEYCPTEDITVKIYLKQGTEGTADENYVLPDSLKNSTCDQHKSWWDRWFGNGEEPENGEENTPSADEKPVEKPDEPAPEPEEDQTQQLPLFPHSKKVHWTFFSYAWQQKNSPLTGLQKKRVQKVGLEPTRS